MGEINFEGKIVKVNKQGYYKCPYKCGPSGYPARKWKTENGFLKHTKECPNRPSVVKSNEKERIIAKNIGDKLKQKIIEDLKWKIGDEINYVDEIVIKPTHEEKWGRMVRVRYEEVKRFEAKKTIINSIDFFPSTYLPNADYVKNNLLCFNSKIPIYRVYSSFEEAKEKAKDYQLKHDDHLRFSSFVR